MDPEPQVVRELKRDALGRVELLDGAAGYLVRRVACGGTLQRQRWAQLVWGPLSRAVAHVLLVRERRALSALGDVQGVPRLLERAEYASAPSADGSVPRIEEVLLRSWLEGRPLWEAGELPSDFFERLADLVEELHARGVCHNDLHKEPNVLVGREGRPALVDFQLASVHPSRGRTFAVRAAEDRRHVEKHARTYRVATGREVRGLPLPRRRSLLARAWMRFGKPLYNLVSRRILRRTDGEPRRSPGGPWPRWTAPLGPSPGRARRAGD